MLNQTHEKTHAVSFSVFTRKKYIPSNCEKGLALPANQKCPWFLNSFTCNLLFLSKPVSPWHRPSDSPQFYLALDLRLPHFFSVFLGESEARHGWTDLARKEKLHGSTPCVQLGNFSKNNTWLTHLLHFKFGFYQNTFIIEKFKDFSLSWEANGLKYRNNWYLQHYIGRSTSFSTVS